jgi:hypothetical protein
MIGPFIEKSIGDLDFSDDAMFRLSLLLSTFDDYQEELDPHAAPTNDDNQAEMNLTFFLYIIKDAMEFNGFHKDKDNYPARELKIALHKFDLLTQKTQYLSKVLGLLEQ